jgi:predicted aconitase
LSICSVAPEPVSLSHEQDEKYAQLKVLGRLFSARGVLLLFSLRKKTSNMADSSKEERFEVRQVKAADSDALAEVYVSAESEKRLEKMKKKASS